jgi:hypothetical protein
MISREIWIIGTATPLRSFVRTVSMQRREGAWYRS